MGLESLKGRRDRCKFKWWSIIWMMRDPRLLLDSEATYIEN